MDKGRINDIAQLKKDLVKPRNALQARKIREAGEAIQKEQSDGYLRSLRESMIKTMKHGMADDQKYYGDELAKHNKRAGIGGGRVSFTISTKGIEGY